MDRFCYCVLDECKSDDGQYIPVVIFEGEKGYRPLTEQDDDDSPVRWGHDYHEAMKTAMKMNKEMGLTSKDVTAIQMSSW